MKRFVRWLTMVAAALHGAAFAAQAEDIEDLLSERWFDVEIIVFERLDVLDATSDEALTLSRPRNWPAALTQFHGEPVDLDAALMVPLDIDTPDEACLGYPLLAEEDPLHPLLVPANEFSDATLAAEAEAESEAKETADAAATDETDTEPDATDIAEASEIELPPQNLPTLTMTPYLQLLADVAAFEASLYAEALQPRADLTLVNHVKALNRQRHLRPLIHQKWRQAVPPRNAPQPIYLSSPIDASAPATEAGYAKVEGFVSVTVGRFLHFAPTLWYHADTLGLAPLALPAPTRVDFSAAERYMALTTSRRMRSGTLHYIDHPKIGVLVRIDPVPFPEELVSVWEALAAGDAAQ